MMINNTLKSLQGQNGTLDFCMIKRFLKILSCVMIIFTITFFTFFGCFYVWNDSTSLAAQTIILSSEGSTNETYPESLGEYQLDEEKMEDGSIKVYDWYKHVDREDRFLMYNKLGNIIEY